MRRDVDKKKYEKLTELIAKCGVQIKYAKALAYICLKGEATAREIETASGLKQPEVSIATTYLYEKRWIKRRKKKLNGKGRPIYIYSLAKPLNETISRLQDMLREKIEDLESAVKELEKFKEE